MDCRLNPFLVQQAGDGVWTGPVALGPQRRSEYAGRLRRPPQRRHRIPALVRFNQRKPCRQQPGLHHGRPLPPPPGRRALPSGVSQASRSCIPRETVRSEAPAARATARIPPCLSAWASAPINKRRCRSSRSGKSTRNFTASACSISTVTPILQMTPPREETQLVRRRLAQVKSVHGSAGFSEDDFGVPGAVRR